MKDIPGFENFAVTKDGRVWSKPRQGSSVSGMWLKPLELKHGYYYVDLQKNGKGFKELIHRLVLETFVGPCPEGMEACHNNGIKKDNHLENLRWDTKSANAKDSVKHGTHSGLQNKGVKNGQSKLTDEKVRVIRCLRKVGFTLKDLAWQFDVGIMTISNVCLGKTWKHVLED